MSPCWTTDSRSNVLVDVQGDHINPNESDATWMNLAALDTAMDPLPCLSYKSFPVSDATAQQSEGWLWTNGKFEYRNGQILIKEQSETPADVWAYRH
jgi:hypothetical protein